MGYYIDAAGSHGLVATPETLPIISGVPAPGCANWPPNYQLVLVAIVTAADASPGLAPGSFKVTGTSNDPANGQIVISGGPNQFLVQLGADKGQVPQIYLIRP